MVPGEIEKGVFPRSGDIRVPWYAYYSRISYPLIPERDDPCMDDCASPDSDLAFSGRFRRCPLVEGNFNELPETRALLSRQEKARCPARSESGMDRLGVEAPQPGGVCAARTGPEAS